VERQHVVDNTDVAFSRRRAQIGGQLRRQRLEFPGHVPGVQPGFDVQNAGISRAKRRIDVRLHPIIDRAAVAADDPHRVAKRCQPTRVIGDGGFDATDCWRAGIVEYDDPFHGFGLCAIS
jgi:hypothetical protein